MLSHKLESLFEILSNYMTGDWELLGLWIT